MQQTYDLVEKLISKNKLYNIIPFMPFERLNHDYGRETIDRKVMRVIQHNMGLHSLIEPLLKGKSDEEQHNLLDNLLRCSRTILKDNEGKYIAFVNIGAVEREMREFIEEDRHFPTWKRTMQINGSRPLYFLFLLETKNLLRLFTENDYDIYAVIHPKDYFAVGNNMMADFIEDEDNLQYVLNVINYVVNQFIRNYHFLMPRNEMKFLQDELAIQMRDVFVNANMKDYEGA